MVQSSCCSLQRPARYRAAPGGDLGLECPLIERNSFLTFFQLRWGSISLPSTVLDSGSQGSSSIFRDRFASAFAQGATAQGPAREKCHSKAKPMVYGKPPDAQAQDPYFQVPKDTPLFHSGTFWPGPAVTRSSLATKKFLKPRGFCTKLSAPDPVLTIRVVGEALSCFLGC